MFKLNSKVFNKKNLLIAYFFGCVFIMGTKKISDYDIWWHLKTGEYITKNWLPTKGVFSFVGEQRNWILHEWLSQVIFYKVFNWLGFKGIILLRGSLIILTFLFSYLITNLLLKNNLSLKILALLLAVLISAASWLERPQLFSFLFFNIILYLLFLYQQTKTKLIFLIPVICGLWINFHSGAVLIYPLLILWFSGDMLQHYLKEKKILFSQLKIFLIILIFSFCLMLINPYGFKLVLYPLDVIFNKYHLENITEWHSPNFHILQLKIFEVAIFLLLISFIFSKEKPVLAEIFLIIFFLHLALQSVRNLPFFAFMLVPVLTKYFPLKANINNKKDIDVIPLNIILFGFLIFLLAYYFPFKTAYKNTVEVKEFPVQGVNYLLKNNLQSNMFNEYDWGGFLLFYLYPKYKVFIDGRADIYAPEIMDEYLSVCRFDENWIKIIKKYNIKIFFLKKDSPLKRYLIETRFAKEIFSGKKEVILIRQ